MSNLASVIFPILITLLIGGIFYYSILGFQLSGVLKMVITLIVMFAAYTILAEALQSKSTY